MCTVVDGFRKPSSSSISLALERTNLAISRGGPSRSLLRDPSILQVEAEKERVFVFG
jgi:hypothetical protein